MGRGERGGVDLIMNQVWGAEESTSGKDVFPEGGVPKGGGRINVKYTKRTHMTHYITYNTYKDIQYKYIQYIQICRFQISKRTPLWGT